MIEYLRLEYHSWDLINCLSYPNFLLGQCRGRPEQLALSIASDNELLQAGEVNKAFSDFNWVQDTEMGTKEHQMSTKGLRILSRIVLDDIR